MALRRSKSFVVTAICVSVTVCSVAPARADGPVPTPTPSPTPSSSVAEAPKPKGSGFAVLTAGPTADATWPVAQSVYRSSLRPPALDEARARVLAGEAPASTGGAPTSTDARDLAELRAGVRGDDAASRQLLSAIADKLSLEGVVVVFAEGDALEVRVWLRDTGAFDAARYRRDAQQGWAPLVASLERGARGASSAPLAPSAPSITPVTPVTPAFAIAPAPTRPRAPDGDGRSGKPFYVSPWFWGAIGAAVFAGGAVYLATRESDNGQIRLQMRVPQ